MTNVSWLELLGRWLRTQYLIGGTSETRRPNEHGVLGTPYLTMGRGEGQQLTWAIYLQTLITRGYYMKLSEAEQWRARYR